MNARRLLRAAGGFSLSWVMVTTAPNALAQATPPSPFRPAAPSGPSAPDKPIEGEPASQPPQIASGPLEKANGGEAPIQRARRQVVALLRGGKPIGVGSVLAGDGRILTALSPLGHGNNIDARFADGKVTRVHVVHSDRGWDLALVAPAAPRTDVGLRASRASVQRDAKLSAFSPGAKDVTAVSVRVKGERTLTGGDNARLDHALELESKHKASELGSPVIDERGDVVAVIAQACTSAEDKPCNLAAYAAPVSAIKGFLRNVPAAGASAPAAPPFGIRGVAYDAGTVKGVRVVAVAARSPARAVGLRAGADTIVAVDGRPVTTPEALADALEARPGSRVDLLVFGGGRYREVRLHLRSGDARGFGRGEPLKRLPWRRGPERPSDPGY